MTMLRFALACVLLSAFGLSSSSSQPEPHSFRISCGALESVKSPPSYTLWHKDTAFTGGIAAKATAPSDITPSLKTLRYFPDSDGPTNCYNLVRVPMGHYTVRIFFGLVNKTEFEKEPIFDISIEGTLVSSLIPGWSKKDDQVFAEAMIFLLNGTSTICFHTGQGDPAILSIEILEVEDESFTISNNYAGHSWDKGVILRTVKRLNCGARKPKFDEDYNGDVWGGNRFWSPATSLGSKSDSRILTEDAIEHASTSPNLYPRRIYQSALVGTDHEPDLTCNVDVEPNRSYSIWLHFAEIDDSVTAEGERVFDIAVSGVTIFEDVDIIKLSGGKDAALVLNSTIAVTGRSLVIVLHAKSGHSLISAIEVFEVIRSEYKTSRDEVNSLQKLKKALGIPSRIGWNGDPCVPQQHIWSGTHCQLDRNRSRWLIDELDLHNQGLKGFLTNDISKLNHLQSINLSQNNIHGGIPTLLGSITSLEILDLSHNSFNGSIPKSLRESTSLRILKLEGNPLLNVSASVDEGEHHSSHERTGIIVLSVILTLLGIIALICAVIWWRRQHDLTRAQHLAARVAPYAQVRLQREVSMTQRQ